MSEYARFRQWASDKALELSAHPRAERVFLRDVQLLNQDLLEVADAVKDLGGGNLLTFFKRARRWLHLLPDPLEEVRYQMRRIRARHGEIGQIKMPEDA
jgi:hypothetical protein